MHAYATPVASCEAGPRGMAFVHPFCAWPPYRTTAFLPIASICAWPPGASAFLPVAYLPSGRKSGMMEGWRKEPHAVRPKGFREVSMRIRTRYTCPLEIVHDLIRGKWKTLLIFQLRHGPQSFTALLRSIEGISEKMLLQQLKELQAFGLIGKTSGEGYPLQVAYWLTDRGMRLLDAVRIMQDVGIAYMVECGQTELLAQKGIPIPEIGEVTEARTNMENHTGMESGTIMGDHTGMESRTDGKRGMDAGNPILTKK